MEGLLELLKADPAARVIQIPARTMLFRAGDACELALVVMRGCIRVSRLSPSGHEVILYRVTPGHTCAITTTCLLSGHPYPVDGQVENDVVAITLPPPRFRNLLLANAHFRDLVFRHHADRINDLASRIESIASERIVVRLARCLLALEASGRVTATHHRLALDIGTAREVVSRALKAWERAGRVRLHRNAVELIDRLYLEAIAASC